jgi:hypothetical protein
LRSVAGQVLSCTFVKSKESVEEVLAIKSFFFVTWSRSFMNSIIHALLELCAVQVTAQLFPFYPIIFLFFFFFFFISFLNLIPGIYMQVVGANKGGVVALLEGLRGFVPFSQISSVSP